MRRIFCIRQFQEDLTTANSQLEEKEKKVQEVSQLFFISLPFSDFR